MIQVKRVYDVPAKEDGVRILVDRLWPRGVKKEGAREERFNNAVALRDAQGNRIPRRSSESESAGSHR